MLDTLMGSAPKTWEGLLGSVRPLHVIELQQLSSVLLKWGLQVCFPCLPLDAPSLCCHQLIGQWLSAAFNEKGTWPARLDWSLACAYSLSTGLKLIHRCPQPTGYRGAGWPSVSMGAVLI